MYASHRVERNTIRVRFSNAESGLMLAEKNGPAPPTLTPDAPLSWLAIQAKDGSWHFADATIDGSDLVVSSGDVAEPVAVRYAWTARPLGSLLYNQEGLRAAPFSTIGYGDEMKGRLITNPLDGPAPGIERLAEEVTVEGVE